MDIDFILDKQPLDKLVTSYIEVEQVDLKLAKSAQVHKKSIVLLNSILINLSNHKQGLCQLIKQVKYCLDINSGNRVCLRRGATLISQVIRKSQYIYNQTSQQIIVQILNFCLQKAFITICGNDFIYLIELITSKSQFQQGQLSIIEELLYNFITNHKLQINSYRQQTRLCLYRIILKLLKIFSSCKQRWLKNNNLDKKFIERCIRAGDGEKDPRNISNVFEVYLRMLELFDHQQIDQYKSVMFQNIQSYYPIEFVGDQDNNEHRRVNVQEISSLLDQCLCHSFFIQQTWQLLTVKTAAPPISTFTPTLTLFIQTIMKNNRRTQFLSRFQSLLLRYSQQQFLQQQYPEQNDEGLGELLIKLLQVIFCNDNGCYNLKSEGMVVNWLQVMLKRLIKKQSKVTGTIISIFRKIINKHQISKFSTLIDLFRSFALKNILRLLNSDVQKIPVLGLAIVAVSSITHVSQNINESMGLLIFTIGTLYAETSDQIKMLILKILLQIYKSCPSSRIMIRKVNDGYIFKDCISRATQSFKSSLNQAQIFFIKAFIDFIACVYLNEMQQIVSHVQNNHYELQTYLLSRLWQNFNMQSKEEHKLNLIVTTFNQILCGIQTIQQKQSFLKGIKILNIQDFATLIFSLDWQKSKNIPAKLLFSIIIQLRQYFIKYSHQIQKTFKISRQNYSTMHNLIYQFFFDEQKIQSSNLSIQQRLWRQINNIKQNETITFHNMKCLNNYNSECNYIVQECFEVYPPSYIHWIWQNVKKIQTQQIRKVKISQVLKYLPEKILLRDSEMIVSILLHDSTLSNSLVKITKNMSIQVLKSNGILQYCLKYIKQLAEGDQTQKSTERNASILAILINLLEKDKNNQTKGQIYKFMKLLKKLLLHRKRVVRQATRKLLTYLQY